MATRKELIAQCRYYNGETRNPFEDNDGNGDGELIWYWDMERVYVSNNGKFNGDKKYYEAINGKKYTGIPYALLLTMFTSWGKFTYDIQKSIKDFYKLIDKYLFVPNDYFPENKIPNKKVN